MTIIGEPHRHARPNCRKEYRQILLEVPSLHAARRQKLLVIDLSPVHRVIHVAAGRETPGFMNRTSSSNLFDQLPHGYRIDVRFGTTYDRAPSGADDLTMICGVDTREAVILNRLGVYFLAQVALWQRREAAAFADELGMSLSTLLEEQWIEQAHRICRPQPVEPSSNSRHLPASVIRTVSLLGCALLVGCMVVYWMSLRTNPSLRGVLSADITSLRVPAESRLLESFVEAGDEIFSGDKLITLEKTEHVAMIRLQEERVRELERQLRQAEAQAALDLAWRSRELDRELSDVRTRAHLIQEVKRTAAEDSHGSASVSSESPSEPSKGIAAQTVSQSQFYEEPETSQSPNSMVFISGASGKSSIDVARPAAPLQIAPVAPQPKPQKVVLASEPKPDAMLSVEAKNVEQRLQRLEELRSLLPKQVRTAAGVESVRLQYEEANQRLTEMNTLSREVAVLCPSHGKVGQVRYQPGDNMSTGEIMLKILHTDRRYVLLHVPTRRVNEIQPGTVVELVFPGDGHYRGKVSNLPMLAESSPPGGTSLVTVRVEPVGRLWPEIPIGSQIDVVVGSKRLF